MNKLIALIFTCFLCLPLYVHGQQNKYIKTDTIPFELRSDNRIYVKVHINESEKPFTFLFDTGASDIVLNASLPHVMEQANFNSSLTNTGATSSEKVPATTANQNLLLGHSKVDNLRFIAIHYPPQAWDGVLGLSFLKHFNVSINYDHKEIYLEPAGKSLKNTSEGIAFKYIAGVPIIPITTTINKRKYPMNVELDTGSDRVLDINTPFVQKHQLQGTLPVFAISSISGTSSKQGRLNNVCFDDVKIGNITFPLLPGAFSSITQGLQASKSFDGVIGNNLLQRFNQTWDFTHQRLYLKVNNRFYTPFYDFLINP